MNEIKINMIEKTEEGLVLKLPTTSVEQVRGLNEKLETNTEEINQEINKKENITDVDSKIAKSEKNIKEELNKSIDKKVDKVSGKGLSTNDYTTEEKAEVAKIKNLATSETVAGIKSEVETLKTSKVDKIVGKGLSTNDYTTAEKTEVAKVKNKADIIYVDNELNKKIDKSSITSDLEGTDENKVLSQKAGNKIQLTMNDFEYFVSTAMGSFADLKIDKTSITSDLAGTDETKVLSQKAGNKLFTSVNDGKGYIANAIIDLDGDVNVSNDSTFTELGDAITNNLKAKN